MFTRKGVFTPKDLVFSPVPYKANHVDFFQRLLNCVRNKKRNVWSDRKIWPDRTMKAAANAYAGVMFRWDTQLNEFRCIIANGDVISVFRLTRSQLILLTIFDTINSYFA